ncbi:hypothetical protein ACIBHY_41040 [Nonomuraea sp. NPDC050547]|uniref:hypothetical protein n=1 Tax=Nonomuraea sp. NPDC050547 TaxID=3364368 RepID=UPI0037A34B8E
MPGRAIGSDPAFRLPVLEGGTPMTDLMAQAADRGHAPGAQVADPSFLVSPEFQEELVGKGFEVKVVKGAEHTIHRHLFEDFMAGLDGRL